jgi:oligosaccharide repeat unit polymerase
MNSFQDNMYLFIYLFAWTVVFLWHQKKKKNFDSGSLILLIYILGSLASIMLFNGDYYTFNELRIFPFIYQFLMLLLISWPIIKYDPKKIIKIYSPSSRSLNIVSIIFIISSVVSVFSIILNFGETINILITDSVGGTDLYNEAWNIGLDQNDGVISNLPAIISSAMSGVGILLTVFYATLKNRNNLIFIGLIISIIIIILPSIASGQRNGIIETAIVTITTFYFLKFLISKVLRKKIILFASIFLILISLPFVYITISRFGETSGASESLYFYAGQEKLYFNNYGLDNGGLRYGDRIFPFFKSIIGFDVPQNFWERRAKYNNLKINDEVFTGIVGDFTLDFGPITTLLIFILATLFVLNKTKPRNGIIYFYQLIPLHFLIYSCTIGGFKLFPFADLSGNLKFIVYIMAYVFFKMHRVNAQNRTDIVK